MVLQVGVEDPLAPCARLLGNVRAGVKAVDAAHVLAQGRLSDHGLIAAVTAAIGNSRLWAFAATFGTAASPLGRRLLGDCAIIIGSSDRSCCLLAETRLVDFDEALREVRLERVIIEELWKQLTFEAGIEVIDAAISGAVAIGPPVACESHSEWLRCGGVAYVWWCGCVNKSRECVCV